MPPKHRKNTQEATIQKAQKLQEIMDRVQESLNKSELLQETLTEIDNTDYQEQVREKLFGGNHDISFPSEIMEEAASRLQDAEQEIYGSILEQEVSYIEETLSSVFIIAEGKDFEFHNLLSYMMVAFASKQEKLRDTPDPDEDDDEAPIPISYWTTPNGRKASLFGVGSTLRFRVWGTNSHTSTKPALDTQNVMEFITYIL